MMIHWICKPFKELLLHELYDCLRLRSEVFVVEQNCVFLDADNIDQKCYHLFGYEGNELMAYTRIVPPLVVYEQASIGRVVTSKNARGRGIGKVLMEQSVNSVHHLFGGQPIKIGAQLYLKKFYESFGFQQISNVYIEDGIEHIYMLRPLHISQNTG